MEPINIGSQIMQSQEESTYLFPYPRGVPFLAVTPSSSYTCRSSLIPSPLVVATLSSSSSPRPPHVVAAVPAPRNRRLEMEKEGGKENLFTVRCFKINRNKSKIQYRLIKILMTLWIQKLQVSLLSFQCLWFCSNSISGLGVIAKMIMLS